MRAVALAVLAFAGAGLAWWAAARRTPAASAGYEQSPTWDSAPGFDFGALPFDFLGGATPAASAMSQAPAQSSWRAPAEAAPYLGTIEAAERIYALPASLLARVLYQESRFRPDIVNGATRSPVGALGIAQFMPATARELGVDPLDPDQAIDAAGRYLRRLYDRFGDWSLALAAYNWGQGNVARRGLGAAPAETRNYVAEISADIFEGV